MEQHVGELEQQVIVLEISTIATEVMIGYLQYQMEQLVASIVVYFGIVDNSS